MPDQFDDHEAAQRTSSDHGASSVEHSLQTERGDEATQGSLQVLKEPADDEDADKKTEPMPLVSWNWMYNIDFAECFMQYDSDAAAKSSDFGNDGYTASLTIWHELLQLTAPDPKCGLIYIRGDFPDTSDAILARVQNQDLAGGKGTFGIQLLNDPADEFQLGSVVANGLINYRWPHILYWLNSKTFGIGTFGTCSFVVDKIVYQIARITPGEERSTEKPTSNTDKKTPVKKTARFRIGGRIRFGCICTNVLHSVPEHRHSVQHIDDSKTLICRISGNTMCEAQESCQYHLSMRLYIDGQRIAINWSPKAKSCRSTSVNHDDVPAKGQDLEKYIDISADHEVELEAEKECVLILALALDSGAIPRMPENAPSSEDVKGILGVTDAHANCTSRIWLARGKEEHEQVNVDDTHAIARGIEYICSVTAVPIQYENHESLASSRKGSTHTGGEPFSGSETASTKDLSTRKSIPITAELPALSSSALPNCESPKIDSESLRILTTSLSSEDSRTGQVTSPQQSTAQQSEDEKILPLHVSLPASVKSTPSLKDASFGKDEAHDVEDIELGFKKDDSDEPQAITLIQNIMFDIFVNLESTFWQLRLLIKADKFLSQRFKNFISTENIARNEERDDGPDKQTMAAYEKYRSRLQTVIKGVLIWMAKLPRGTHVSRGHSSISDEVDPYSSIRPISHHYVQLFEIHRYSWTNSKWITNTLDRPPWNSHWQAACFVSITIWYILDNYPEIAEDILSISSLWKNVPDLSVRELPREAEPRTPLLQWYHTTCVYDLLKKIQRRPPPDQDGTSAYLKKLEQMSLRLTGAAKKPNIYLYTIEDEQLDRLLLICNEVIHKSTSANTRISCIANVRSRIERRNPTTIINPGFTVRKSKISNEPPWELSCLNHHTALRMAVESDYSTEVNELKQACYDFRSTEFTFHPTWDRSKRQMSEQWWDIDASAIVCATLLHPYIREAGKTKLITTDNQKLQLDVQASTKLVTLTPLPQSNVAIFDLKKNLTPIVFGDDWVQSLEDTPDKFRGWQTKDTNLRHGLRTYLQSFRNSNDSDINPPQYSRDEIHQQIPAEDLLYLSYFDLGLNEVGDLEVEYSWCRWELFGLRKMFFDDILKVEDTGDTSDDELWAWVLDGSPWKSFRNLKDVPEEIKTRLEPLSFRQDLFKGHQRKGLERLSDSMVDCGVKHRILLAQRLCPSIVRALVYMWHPRAIDTFDSYFGSLSSFSNVREDDSWITTITLVYWAFEPRSDVLDLKSTLPPEDRYTEPRQRGKFPPPKMMQQKQNKSNMSIDDNTQHTIEERSSSLVITGDSQGYLWTCSIWSSLIDDAEFDVDELSQLTKVLQLFKHQQSTGRSLVFLSLLGILCEKLSAEIDRTLKGCDEYVRLGQKVFLEGYDWEADSAVDSLRSMLWGLEALKTFDDKLDTSLKSIKEAHERLVYQMDTERGERHAELKKTYKDVLEKFGKQHDFLSATHAKIDLKIKQVTGLRDGLSTATSVADSRTAIKQGNNIRMLTYITIAYLPLSFIAAIFSMGHNIVPDEAGTTLFAILIVAAVLATYCLASSLGSLIRLQDNLMNRWKARQPKRSQTSGTWGNKNGTSKRKDEGGDFGKRDTVHISSVLSGTDPHPEHSRFRGFRWRPRLGGRAHSSERVEEV